MPPLPGVLEVIAASANEVNRYPDMGCTQLIEAIAKQFSVPAEHVCPGTGGVGVIQQVVQATCNDGDEVVYAWRSFEAYPIIATLVGALSVQVPLTASQDHDLDAMAAAVTEKTRLIIVCNPNNPTGNAISGADLSRFLDKIPSNVPVLIDEAYREFVRNQDVVDGITLYQDRPNVVVLRTFSKAYGLAGLRVGFAIAHEPISSALRKAAVPFGVSQIAQDAAIASLALTDELFSRVEELVRERTRVLGTLRAQGWADHGRILPDSEANFVWLQLGAATEKFTAACAQAGIAVRPFSGEGARISIGESAANDLFLDVASKFRTQLAR